MITKDKMSRYLDKFFLLVLCKIRLKGLFIFYEVGGGAGGIFGGPCKKIWLQRGGQPKKYGV